MTEQESKKISAEIAMLMAGTMKAAAEVEKMATEVEKMRAEGEKIRRENHFYPIVVGATATLAIVAIVKLFL